MLDYRTTITDVGDVLLCVSPFTHAADDFTGSRLRTGAVYACLDSGHQWIISASPLQQISTQEIGLQDDAMANTDRNQRTDCPNLEGSKSQTFLS